MTAIKSGKVLVTGANGYIAVWVVQKYLDAGYSVRGTVRSERSMPYLKKLFRSYGSRFELVLVPDMTKDGAFDEAVKGVDAVAHTASPFHFNAKHPNELFVPAVRGTTTILESTLKHGTQVKRVVVLSSVAAIIETGGYTPKKPSILTEKDWNVKSIAKCQKLGRGANGEDKYYASKSLAERAMWEFEAKHKNEMKFDLVALNPPYVFGPFLHEVTAPENLNTSMLILFNEVIKGKRDPKSLSATHVSWVDVRDIAAAHIDALRTPTAAGERIIISSDWFTWQEWVEAAHAIDSSIPAGIPGFDIGKVVARVTVNATKSRKLFRTKYIDLAQSMADMLAQFKEREWC